MNNLEVTCTFSPQSYCTISVKPFLFYYEKAHIVEGTQMGKVNGKSIPLQAWTDPEGSRRLRLPDFKTFDT